MSRVVMVHKDAVKLRKALNAYLCRDCEKPSEACQSCKIHWFMNELLREIS